jgi:hypothetical protein
MFAANNLILYLLVFLLQINQQKMMLSHILLATNTSIFVVIVHDVLLKFLVPFVAYQSAENGMICICGITFF